MVKEFQGNVDNTYPEIYLAIDNCFASKRYTEPDDWMSLISDLGISFIEASSDTECDPLYMGREYLRKWVDKAYHASVKYGVSISNLYSGHGTYSTLGLSHTDPLVRDRILNGWLKPMIETAAALGAGLGFFCHAFPNSVLQKPDIHLAFKKELIKNLAETAQFANVTGCKTIGLEQMYSPHQIPWTIEGARDLMNQIIEKSVQPMYITIDTGHQSGQANFLRPEKEALIRAMEQYREDRQFDPLWLGPDAAYTLLETCKKLNRSQFEDLVNKISNKMENCPYLFSEIEDGSPYRWLEKLASYSPVIHLQQTDGTSSSHWPFTQVNNEKGIIEGRKVLEAIKTSYDNQYDLKIPKVDKIYMTIEIFAPIDSMNYFTIRELQESIKYWRQFIPEDGKKLNELL
jgi:D-erythrulose 1-phosphate 3-epimerase